MEIVFNWVVPVLRIFDIAKADEFYQGFLGFSVDWDHRFDANLPADFARQSNSAFDRAPRRRKAFHREISAKGYRYMRPGLETTPWGTIETGVIDPFGNLIRFCQLVEKPATS
jgi:hypothetical protein